MNLKDSENHILTRDITTEANRISFKTDDVCQRYSTAYVMQTIIDDYRENRELSNAL